MANHLFTRAGGIWADDTDLLHSEMADIDAKTVDALSGTGGVYSLAEDLVIGGAPGAKFHVEVFSQFDANVLVNGDLFVEGNTDLGSAGTSHAVGGDLFDVNSGIVTIGTTGADAFTVNSFSQFEDIVTFQGDTLFNNPAAFNDSVVFGDDATFNGTNLDVNSGIVTIGTTGADALTVNSFTQFSDVVDFNGDVIFGAVAQFDGGMLVRTPMTFGNTGRIVQRQVIGTDANTTFLAVSQSHVHVPAGVLTASRNYTIDFTGALAGDRVRFSSMETDGAKPILIKTTGGAALTSIVASTGSRFWCEIELFAGGFLRVVGAGTMP